MDDRNAEAGKAAPPNLLTPSQRAILARLCSGTFHRTRRGFEAPGQPVIQRRSAEALRAAGVAELKMAPGHPRLTPTDLGRQIAGWQKDRRTKNGGGNT